MNRQLLKKSIDDWEELYRRSLTSLKPRDFEIIVPTLDFAIALTGVRRSGKTHIAFHISKDFQPDKVFYYNFEDPLFFTSTELSNLDLLLSVAQEFREEKIELLILDEIHVVDGWERWLRKLIDQKLYRIVVTGSSAKLLSSELATSLTGRTIEKKVWPLSYREVINFLDLTPRTPNDYLSILRQMLQWGGFPEVVKLTNDYRAPLLKQYLSDIVNKDVVSRHQVRNKRALDQILTYYLTNLSSLHSYNSIAKSFQLDTVTASEYTRILSEAFLVSETHRYHSNLKVQSRDPKKAYIIDPGFRTVGARSVSDDTGKLLENLIQTELLRREKEFYYYKGKQEVDFVVVEQYKPVEIIQVSASNLEEGPTRTREINALMEAMQTLGLQRGLILSLDGEEVLSVEGREIAITPAYKWLLG